MLIVREALLMQKLLPYIHQLQTFTCFYKTVRQPIGLVRQLSPRSSFLLRFGHQKPRIYKVWSVMQEHVYKKRIKDIDELLAHLLTAWYEIDQRIIDAAIRQWRTCLRHSCMH